MKTKKPKYKKQTKTESEQELSDFDRAMQKIVNVPRAEVEKGLKRGIKVKKKP